MANLAIIGSHSINGVAKLHTQILVKDVFKNYYAIMPEKFNNKTNGITHRRWLVYSNPQLTELLKDTIGDSFIKHPQDLVKLMDHIDDAKLQQRFLDVKMERKQILADYIKKNVGIEVDVNSIFDVQAKRLHAYKRQLLNVMHIIYLYQRMKADSSFRIYPRTFIFAAKAAPAYHFAKKVIELINSIAAVVNNDPEINRYMKVVFIPNYSVSIAEILMNAADVSEQISTAGKEASGTGNMKFMLNCAATLGTADGANVEIAELVGEQNIYTFGESSEQVIAHYQNHDYISKKIYKQDPHIKQCVDFIVSKELCSIGSRKILRQLQQELINKDWFMTLLDLNAYIAEKDRCLADYEKHEEWTKKMLVNIAKAGFFSSDRTIAQYNQDIWKL